MDRLTGWVLPPRCVLCGRPGQPPAFDLCADCEAELPVVPNPCWRCGLPCNGAEGQEGQEGQEGKEGKEGKEGTEGMEDGCARCRALDLPYSCCVAPWAYEFPVTQLVQALKYEGALANARVFGTRLVMQALREPGDPSWAAALVVPMPLHPSRLVERGFNQAHEIARVVSRLLGLRLAANGLRRVRGTAPQVGLSRRERAGNLSGAFAADAGIVAGQHVVLIDDVVTTGSTAGEAAATLRAAGAESVAVWAVARALG
ncbi:MAG: ComF family protein [Steroidobacteraceae bacterium]